MSAFEVRPDASDDWREQALCRQSDADYWFPETTGNSATHTLAKRICEQCPVIEQCLQFALDNNERYGIWGGKSEHQRARLKSERRSGVRMHGTRGAPICVTSGAATSHATPARPHIPSTPRSGAGCTKSSSSRQRWPADEPAVSPSRLGARRRGSPAAGPSRRAREASAGAAPAGECGRRGEPMSVELRIRAEGQCDHGPKFIGEPRTECRHVLECDWGDIEHPDPRPARGDVGPLMLIGREYLEALVTAGPRRRSDGGLDSVTVDRDNHRLFVHLDYERRWTWELFDAHWWDGVDPTVYLGRWPD